VNKLSALKTLDPKAWFAEVSAAIVAAKGLPSAAAKRLEARGYQVAVRTLARWIAQDSRLQELRPEQVPRGRASWTRESLRRAAARDKALKKTG
jgi:hypothetical protein